MKGGVNSLFSYNVIAMKVFLRMVPQVMITVPHCFPAAFFFFQITISPCILLVFSVTLLHSDTDQNICLSHKGRTNMSRNVKSCLIKILVLTSALHCLLSIFLSQCSLSKNKSGFSRFCILCNAGILKSLLTHWQSPSLRLYVFCCVAWAFSSSSVIVRLLTSESLAQSPALHKTRARC